MVDLVLLKKQNLQRWNVARLTRGPEFVRPAQTIFNHKIIYVDIQNSTGVHWLFVAASHYRESSLNFNDSLAQGDPWNRVSIHVPAGRGPFHSFQDAAYDALVNCAPHAARNHDWSIGSMLTYLEQYNGLGYAGMGRPSPYLWSGTDQYVRGKYTSDGHYNPSTVDQQLGCAGLIMSVMHLDPSITFPEPEPVYDALWLQHSLNLLGQHPPLQEDGINGSATTQAVRAFQKAHGLQQDGKAGTVETIPAILNALKELDT